ncbi:spectrin beta chain non-erythrocytic 5-like [Crotalus adamanteus]|uniref:Spectrin beta chain non-erythrocytic 5-like n=1 Tax=Crotalus adamanteus TaxID=8729 RepID=A0AAW1C5Q5_CROAD
MGTLEDDLTHISASLQSHKSLQVECDSHRAICSKIICKGQELRQNNPSNREIQKKLEDIQQLWQQLQNEMTNCKIRLDTAALIRQYFADINEVDSWLQEKHTLLASKDYGKDESSAEALLHRHLRLEKELAAYFTEISHLEEQVHSVAQRVSWIDDKDKIFQTIQPKADNVEAMQQKFQSFLIELAVGKKQLDEISSSADMFSKRCPGKQKAIQSRKQEINKRWECLETLKEEKGSELIGVTDVKTFLQDCQDTQELLQDKMASLENLGQGSKPAVLQGQAHKLSACEREILVLERKIEYQKRAANLVAQRRNELDELWTERQKKLQENIELQKFIKEVDSILAAISSHEAFLQTDNLGDHVDSTQSLLKRHEDFEQVLLVLKRRANAANGQGEQLIERGHFACDSWKLKGEEEFIRDTAELLVWMEEKYKIASDESYHDPTNILRKLKRHEAAEQEMMANKKHFMGLMTTGNQLIQNDHYAADSIQDKMSEIKKKWEKLYSKMIERGDKLRQAGQQEQLMELLEDADEKIEKIERMLRNAELGHDLRSSRNLLKEHRQLENEMQGLAEKMNSIVSHAKSVATHHFNRERILDDTQSYLERFDSLQKPLAERGHLLEASVELFQFYHYHDMEMKWINERMSIANSTIQGKSLNGVQSLLQKQRELQIEVKAHKQQISRVLEKGNAMAEDMCKPSRRIKEKSERLEETLELHDFLRECEDLEGWINEQKQVASSEDYGADYDHVLVLCVKYDKSQHQMEIVAQRVAACDQLAQKMLDHGHFESREIRNKQKQLKNNWQELLEMTNYKGKQLQDAEAIYKCLQDLTEALSHIEDKLKTIPDSTSKDLSGVKAQLRKQATLEHELFGNEQQLHVLIDTADGVLCLCSERQAEAIKAKQQALVENWEILRCKVEQNREQLERACRLYRFQTYVWDYSSWASEMIRTMAAEETIRDASTSGLKINQHQQLLPEIESRDEIYERVSQLGQELALEQKMATEEIQSVLKTLIEAKRRVYQVWAQKKEWLEKTHLLQIFYRDCEYLDNISNSQEIYLKSCDFGSSVDEVIQQIKKHEAFEKILASQEEKELSLQEQMEKLQPGSELEAESWIAERMQKIKAPSFQNFSKSCDKMKLLQKHQVFEAEILAHKDIIASVNMRGEALLHHNIPQSEEIRQKMYLLQEQWEKLDQAVAAHGKMLEESRDFLEFLQKVDHAEAWIRDKVVMVNIGDVGNDYEHCLQLLKKLNEFRGMSEGVTVDDAHIRDINALALRLKRQNEEEMKIIRQRQEQLNERWNSFYGDLKTYKRKLEEALQIHALIREIDDITERIGEKSSLIQALDYGKDVESVENLLRKQDEMEREIGIIQSKMESLEPELCQIERNPSTISNKLTTKQKEMGNHWLQLQNETKQRGEKLIASYQLQKFNSELKELLDWIQEVKGQMEFGDLPKNLAEAESLIEEHQEIKAKIEARGERLGALSNYGQKLGSSGHYAAPEIHHSLIKLQQALNEMIQTYEEQSLKLLQARDLQIFFGYVEESESWLSSKEAFLTNKDLGDSVSSVESLQQKHMQFEKDLKAHLKKIDKITFFAQKLKDSQHYDSENIMTKCQAVLRRKEKLLEITLIRRRLLEESWLLQKFLHNSFEIAAWMNEKNSIALDENWRDPSNLQAKLQKHQTFQAEIVANKNHLNRIKTEGEKMFHERHYASDVLQSRLQEIDELWDELLENCEEKKRKILDAYKALQFLHLVDEADKWLEDLDGEMNTPESSDNLLILNDLLKKQEELEASFVAHRDHFQSLINRVQEFQQEKHFLADETEIRVDQVVHRYKSFREPLQERRQHLEANKLLYQFLQDVNEELTWIHDKLPLASSRDYGQSLATVQSLQEKHQNLENEINSHDALTKAVISSGQKLAKEKQVASQTIMEQVKKLTICFENLKDETQERRWRLVESHKAQHFFSELLEVESWMAEKGFLLETPDYGRNEESTQALLRKMEATKLDLEGFKSRIEKLKETGDYFLNSNNPDSSTILPKLQTVLEQYLCLQDRAERQIKALQEQSQLHHFEREIQLVDAWLLSKQTMAESDNYGQDLENVEVLEKKFEDFMKEVESLGHNKVLLINNLASHLRTVCHNQISHIQKKTQDIHDRWEKLQQAVQTRAENLRAAHQVHQYDRDVDDLKGWMQEKEAVVTRDDYGYDLLGVQTLLSQHEGVERELVAISKELERVRGEACRLGCLYPLPRENMMNRLSEVDECWEKLDKKCVERKLKLQQAEQVQIYFNDCRELTAWARKMHSLIVSEEVANDLLGAELLIKRHKEYKLDIDKQWLKYEDLEQIGNNLVKDGHFMCMEIKEKLSELLELMQKVREIWNMKKDLYEENWEIQLLKRELDFAETWLTAKESFLSDSNYGNSVSDVKHLLKKHQDFEKMLEAQEEKFAQLNRKTKRELKLLRQVTIEENEQMTKLIKVPSLRRRHSDRRSTMLEPKKTQQLSLRSSISNLRKPLSVSPTQNSKESLHQISSEEDLILINDSPEPRELGVENSMPQMENSLCPSLTSDLNIQQADVEVLESHTGDFNPSDVKDSCETSSSELETSEMKTLDGQGSPDDCQGFLRSDLAPEGSEAASQISANQYIMAGFLEKRDQVLSRKKEPKTRAWNTFYVQLQRHKLDFYNDEKEVIQKILPDLSLSIAGARCERLMNYPRKQYAFSLRTSDGAEYYLAASSEKLMEDWMQALWSNLDHNSNQKAVLINVNVVKPQIKPWISAAGTSTHKQTNKGFLLRRTPSFKANREERLSGSSVKSEISKQNYKTLAPNSKEPGSGTEPMVNTTKYED